MARDASTDTRDRALRKVARLNRLLLAGSVTLTGVLAELAAHTFAGRTIDAARVRAGASRTRGARGGASTSRAPSRPLQPPARAPQADAAQPSQAHSAEQPSAAPEASGPEVGASTGEAARAQQSAPAPQEAQPRSEGAQESAPVVSGGS